MDTECNLGRNLPGMLDRYRSQAVAESIGCSRQVVHAWKTGAALPDVRVLPALAKFLGLDLAELTQIVADASTARSQAQVA